MVPMVDQPDKLNLCMWVLVPMHSLCVSLQSSHEAVV